MSQGRLRRESHIHNQKRGERNVPRRVLHEGPFPATASTRRQGRDQNVPSDRNAPRALINPSQTQSLTVCTVQNVTTVFTLSTVFTVFTSHNVVTVGTLAHVATLVTLRHVRHVSTCTTLITVAKRKEVSQPIRTANLKLPFPYQLAACFFRFIQYVSNAITNPWTAYEFRLTKKYMKLVSHE